jgi:hypothetical protein
LAVTKHEVIQAFVSGEIGRRDFVRRLTALGVSSSAALAYAHSLAPDAGAAGVAAGSAYVTRAQADPDGDYGAPIPDDLLCDLFTLLISIRQAVLESINALIDSNVDEDLGQIGSAQILQRLQEMGQHAATQLVVLQELADESCGTALATSFKRAPLAQADEVGYGSLAELLDLEAGLYTAVVPAIVDPAVRQTLMSIGMVVARHAAFARVLAGEAPAPTALEEPIPADEAAERFQDIQGG